ncbi:hypothetical protein KR067_003392 [Drosophila pandora]|nr:hypothetical protein KR067_003392 [Drosophila pandora]
MPRLFNTRRLFLGSTKRVSPCKGISLLLLGTICVLLMLHLKVKMDSRLSGLSIATTAQPPRIFCIIPCFKYRHDYAGIHVHRTWAQHCDHFLFVSDNVHNILEPAVFPGLYDKWHLLRAHLEYVHNYHFHQGDWFLYANDDNFVMVENLREMVKPYSHNELIYFGCKMKDSNSLPYMYEKSGILFSAASLKRFVLEALPNETICTFQARGDKATEELGRCLGNVNVIDGDSRDEQLGHRFLPFDSRIHLGSKLNESISEHKDFLDNSYYPVKDKQIPVSIKLISLPLDEIRFIYDLYYLAYIVRIFGVPIRSSIWEPQKSNLLSDVESLLES